MLEVRVLGGFDVRLDEEPVEIPSRPAQSLFAYLILTCGTRHRRERLAGLLWPESDETNARSNLRHALWRIRKAIGETYIYADKVTVEFNGDSAYSLDVSNVLNVDEEQNTIEEMVEALSLYGGELLPGFYENWVVLERERVRTNFERKLQSLLEMLHESERWLDIVEWSERWIALGYAPESPYRSMMIAYGALGDLAKVSVVFQRCQDVLHSELGVEPSPQTQSIYERAVAGEFTSTRSTPVFERIPEQDEIYAVRSLLGHWREKDIEVLDVASLAIVHAAGEKQNLDEDDFSYVLHSTFQHGLDVTPWIEQAASPAIAVSALQKEYERYPRPEIRSRIVDALADIEGDEANLALMVIVQDEDVPRVRVAASLAAAERLGSLEVSNVLIRAIDTKGSTSALASLAAVADEYGLPSDVQAYPRSAVRLAVVQRRWRQLRDVVFRQSLSIGASGALTGALYGVFIPFLFLLAQPDYFNESLEFFTLPAWILSGAIAMAIIGGGQGFSSGLVTGIADVIVQEDDSRIQRYVIGSLSGLFYSIYLILFSMMGLLSPVATAQVYIPISILYGLALGVSMTLIIPPIRNPVKTEEEIKRMIVAILIFSTLTIPYTILVYQDQAAETLFSRMIFAIMYPLGIGLAILRKERRGNR